MAEAAALSASYTEVPVARLKRLRLPIVNPVATLREVDVFLHELVACSLGELDGRHFINTPVSYEAKPKDLLLTVSDKRFSDENVQETLYLSDVASLLQSTYDFLSKAFPSRTEIQALRDNQSFKVLPLDLIRIDDATVSESKAFDQRRNLLAQVQALALATSSLLEQEGQEAELQHLPAAVLFEVETKPLIAWNNFVYQLAEAFREAPNFAELISLENALGPVPAGNYPAGEITQLFNQFTLSIIRLVRDPAISEKLSVPTRQRLQNYASQAFYFPEIFESKQIAEQARVEDFIAFFGQEVIPYLLGQKQLEVEPESAAGAPAPTAQDAGAEEPAATPLQPLGPTATREVYFNQVRGQIVATIIEIIELQKNTLSISSDLTFLRTVQDTARAELTTRVTEGRLNILFNNLLDQAEAEGVTLVDPETGLILINAQTQPWLDQFVQFAATSIIENDQLTIDFVDTIINRVQVERTIEPEAPPIKPAATAVVSAIRANLNPAFLANLPPVTTTDSDWWGTLSVQERLAVLKQSQAWWGQLRDNERLTVVKELGVPVRYESVVQALTFDSLREFLASQTNNARAREYFMTLSPEVLIQVESYAFLQNELNRYLLTQLGADEFFSLFYSTDRLQVWANLRLKSLAYLQNFPQFNIYRQDLLEVLEQKDLDLYQELLPRPVERQNVQRNVDVLVVVAKNPGAMIDGLTTQKAKELFSVDLASDEDLQKFKQLLQQQVALRQLQYQWDGLAENEDVENLFPTFRTLAASQPQRSFMATTTRPYDYQFSIESYEQADEEDKKQLRQEALLRRSLLESMWATLENQEQQAIYQELGVEAPSRKQLAVPDQLDLRQIYGQYQQRTIKPRGGVAGRIQALLGRTKAGGSLAFGRKLEKAGVTAISTAMNVAVPFSGTVFKIVHDVSKVLGVDFKTAALGVGALLAGAIYATGQAFTTLFGFIGGSAGTLIGFAVGGAPGALVGFGGGSWLGYGVGQATGIHTLSDLTNRIGSFFGQSGPITLAQPLLPAAVPAMAMGAVAVGGFMAYQVTETAFLNPLPTISGQEISKYVEIEKVAQEGTQFDSPTDITYQIRMRARDGYSVELTEVPTDVFTIQYNQDLNDSSSQEIPENSEYQAYQESLSALNGQTLTNDWTNVGAYTVAFGSAAEGRDYNHANITNTFTITFLPTTSDGQPVDEITSPITAKTAEVICFGECPQSQGGCWPADGWVQQTTANEQNTHNVIWAIDIRNRIGTPIYSTQPGQSCSYAEGTGIGPVYGNHVVVTTPAAQSPLSAGFQLLYGHMNSLEGTPGSCSAVTPGQQIGTMGISGLQVLDQEQGTSGVFFNPNNSHIHYEIRTENGGAARAAVTAAGLRLEDLVPEGEMVLGGFVRALCVESTGTP